MQRPVHAFALTLATIAVGTVGCGDHGGDQSAPATTAASPTIAKTAPTITPTTADTESWIRAANRVCLALFKRARANPFKGPSRNDIVDPPFEHYDALTLERAAIALAAIPAPAKDKPSIRRAVSALHDSAINHEAAATLDSARSAYDDDPMAILDYDTAIDSDVLAQTILGRLGAKACHPATSTDG